MKKKLVRTIRTAVIALVILAIVSVVGVALLANTAVKTSVEKAGVKTLNVPVQVQKASVSLLRGSAILQTIAVANPEGYQGPSLLTLQTVDVSADAGSLLRSEILIHDMQLKGMEVFVEQDGLKNNLYEVIEPLRRPHEPTGKALVIDRLTIEDIIVHVALPSLPGQSQAQTMDLKVAPITMTDLGRNERMDTTLLIGKVVLAVAAGVADQGGGILPKETLSGITGVLDKAIDIGRILFGGKKDQ
ncbi:MAG: hypothetical protein ABFE13_23435 [Phycisphaerales bacterium]